MEHRHYQKRPFVGRVGDEVIPYSLKTERP